MDIQTRIDDIEEQMKNLPKGTLTYKKINGKDQPYLQRTMNGRTVSAYIKTGEREQVMMDLKKRDQLQEELGRLRRYQVDLREILRQNPYLDRRVSTGYQDFYDIMSENYMYVDKTAFLKEWWDRPEQVSLITRPRRFGKTLMLSVVDHYFSITDRKHPEYYQKLAVWKHERMRSLYGTIPVIRLSFGAVKSDTASVMIRSICLELEACVNRFYDMLMESDRLTRGQKESLARMRDSLAGGEWERAERTILLLSELVTCHYGQKPILLLDEYDTPLTEAYTGGAWDGVIDFFRRWFNATFKENSYYRKGLITGVARVSKNSLFSDMNLVRSYSCTDSEFAACFGFTEQEVMDLLQCQDVHEMEEVKAMYDGFIFGNVRDIYNPWSISSFMVDRRYRCYWINTSSNEVIGNLIRRYPVRLKRDMEDLLQGKLLHKKIDEDIAFQYLDDNEEAFWSLLLATGYIRATNVIKDGPYTECDVEVTNRETMMMFEAQMLRMFPKEGEAYQDFVDALLGHRIEEMEAYLRDLTYSTISYFDTGRGPANRIPENFYHGLFLGLIASLRKTHRITSYQESGLGRYDIAIVPYDINCGKSFLVEFKVLDPKVEKNLEDTVERALQQIEEKNYEAELLAQGVARESIFKIGIAFEGKEVSVGMR